MKVIICNSKSWFNFENEKNLPFSYKVIKDNNDLTLDFLEAYAPDYIFFVHWNWIVGQEIYEKFECVVFHTAPLPYGRGGSPIQNLILNGFDSAPVCALKMIGELDAGPIYSKKDIELSGSLSDIFAKINKAVNILIIEIVTDSIIPQDQKGTPFKFNRLTEKDNELPDSMTVKDMYDRVRMLDHEDYPNAYIIHDGIRLEFFDASLEEDVLNLSCKVSKV